MYDELGEKREYAAQQGKARSVCMAGGAKLLCPILILREKFVTSDTYLYIQLYIFYIISSLFPQLCGAHLDTDHFPFAQLSENELGFTHHEQNFLVNEMAVGGRICRNVKI